MPLYFVPLTYFVYPEVWVETNKDQSIDSCFHKKFFCLHICHQASSSPQRNSYLLTQHTENNLYWVLSLSCWLFSNPQIADTLLNLQETELNTINKVFLLTFSIFYGICAPETASQKTLNTSIADGGASLIVFKRWGGGRREKKESWERKTGHVTLTTGMNLISGTRESLHFLKVVQLVLLDGVFLPFRAVLLSTVTKRLAQLL